MSPSSLHPSWRVYLEDIFDTPAIQRLSAFLDTERTSGKTILPDTSLWFNALNTTPFEDVKVVILGQDPYPTPGHAHGLCFSVMPNVKPLPKSLHNIFKELQEDTGIDHFDNGSLKGWAKQGVLLLNAVLTVEAGRANAHQGKGWEYVTDAVIDALNRHKEGVVFVLWGGYAQKKGARIDTRKHHMIQSPHPSPLSAYRGFFGSRPFTRINTHLAQNGQKEVDWSK